MSETVSISTLDGTGRFDCYLARPAGKPRAAIVVIQEIFGVNAGIRRKCDRLAEDGYLALAPDLFWRVEPHVELDPDIEDQFAKALGLMGQFDQDEGVSDIEATIKYARNSEGCSKVGAVGYYAVGIDNLIREKHAIARPLMLHIAGADHFVTPEVQKAMHAGLNDHPKVTLCDYPGLDHGFATEIGSSRNEEGAELADKRTAEFFAEHLG